MGPAGTEKKVDCAGESQQQSVKPEQARWHYIPEVNSISIHGSENLKNRVLNSTQLHGLSPQANYTDRLSESYRILFSVRILYFDESLGSRSVIGFSTRMNNYKVLRFEDLKAVTIIFVIFSLPNYM
jgi:hypothetical protein